MKHIEREPEVTSRADLHIFWMPGALFNHMATGSLQLRRVTKQYKS